VSQVPSGPAAKLPPDVVGARASSGGMILDVLKWLGPLLALGLVYAVFWAIEYFMPSIEPKTWFSYDTFETILRQTTVVGIAALGMTLVIISAGIDLSAGSVVALVTVAIAWVLREGLGETVAADLPGWQLLLILALAVVAGLAAGTACGAINGILVTSLRVVPFIVTLGMMLLARGVGKGIAHQEKIMAPVTELNDILASLPPERSWMLLPPGVWVLIVLAVLTALLLRYTVFGRHVFAVGSNEQTARLCGVPIAWVKIRVFGLSGFLVGLAGLMQFSRLGVGDPTAAIGLELDIIAAVVIGGGSLSGGEGSILGTIVGALIMGVIRAGCIHVGWEVWIQEVITGAIIIAAVALDNLRHRRVT
jgi:ribose transport system permease protein